MKKKENSDKNTSPPDLSALKVDQFYWVKLKPYNSLFNQDVVQVIPVWEPMQLGMHRVTNAPAFYRGGVLYQFGADEIEAVGPQVVYTEG